MIEKEQFRSALMVSTSIGSSAGAVAAAASGLAAITIGTDADGNAKGVLLSGAANDGVVALRPTFGLVSRTGILPIARLKLGSRIRIRRR